MNKTKYQQLVEETTPKENRLLNMFISLITGGLIGVIGTLMFNFFIKYYNEELSIAFVLLVFIIISALVTTLGIGDNLFKKLKCGLIVPITGFAHSIASCLIDYKREGLLNMGSNTFKLAGSVLLSGIIAAIIFTLLKVILNV